MKTFAILAVAALATLLAQAPQDSGAAKGKAGAKGGGKGAAKGKADDTKAPPAPPVIPQVMRLLRTDTYLVTGRGTNSVFRVTPQGVILVDTKLANPGEYERLVEYIRGITPQPVKWIANTSAKPDASGNNPKFLSTGAALMSADRPEAKLIKVGDNTAVFFPSEKVVVLGDVSKTDPAIQKLEWTLAVPPNGEPTYR
jgi:glyoxylase-like metal-dependent hydrolase (beta-lactamase superfamily II)